MALSLEVSSADVAYRKSLGESLCSPEVPGREDAGCLWRPQGESGFMTCVGEDGCCKVGNCSGIDGRENDRQALGPHLIQQNDVRSLKDGAGYGHSLLLATTQLQTPLPDLCLISCGY